MLNDQPLPTPPTPISSAPVKVISSSGNSNRRRFMIVGSIMGILLAGIGTAVVLIQNQQRLSTGAWNCTAYNFHVSQTGLVTATNQSDRNEPLQKVSITIDGSPVALLDVPALPRGTSAELGTVSVPASGTFVWEAVGTIDCSDRGSYTGTVPTATPTPTEEVTPTPTTPVTPSPTQKITPTPTDEPEPTPTDEPEPTPTSVPGPTPTDTPGEPNSCGGTCGSNYNCASGYFCYQGFCRESRCPTEEDCTCDEVAQAPTPTPVKQLVQSGAVENTILLSGAALLLLGLGVLLAL